MDHNMCPVCKGSKKCPNCNGKGYKMEKVSILATAPWKLKLTGRSYEIKRKTCYTCQGDGLCPECHGTGFIEDSKSEMMAHIHEKFEEYVDSEAYNKAKQLLDEAINQNGKHPSLLYDLGQLLSIKR